MIASTSLIGAIDLLAKRGTPITIVNIAKHLLADAREVKDGLLQMKRDELVVEHPVEGVRVWERRA